MSLIITSHTFLNFSNMYSWCIDGRVGSTLIACPPKGRECFYSFVEEYVLVCTVLVTSTEGCTEGGNEYEDGESWTCSDGCNTW